MIATPEGPRVRIPFAPAQSRQPTRGVRRSSGSGLGAEARLVQLGVGVGYRIGGQLIGGLIGVVAVLLAGQERPVIGFIPR